MKIRMYGLLSFFLFTMLIVPSILTLPVSAEASDGIPVVSEPSEAGHKQGLSDIQISPIRVFMDGQCIYAEIRPTIVQDRLMVPVRQIFEKLGAEVVWEENTRSVIITGKQGQGDKMNSEPSRRVLDENDNGKMITLHQGEEIQLYLNSNPSTGFTWVLNEQADNTIISISDAEFQTDVSAPAGVNIVGAGGKECWHISALNSGSTTLSLSYMRPWESVPALHIFELEIEVLE